MSLGSHWKSTQAEQERNDKAETSTDARSRAAKNEVLALPLRVQIAEWTRLKQIRVMSDRLRQEDLNVTATFEELQKSLYGRHLKPDDFKEDSVPYAVIKACTDEDLGCRMIPEVNGSMQREHILYARFL